MITPVPISAATTRLVNADTTVGPLVADQLFRTAPTRKAEFVTRSNASMSAEDHASKKSSSGKLSQAVASRGDADLPRLAYSVGPLSVQACSDLINAVDRKRCAHRRGRMTLWQTVAVFWLVCLPIG